MCVWCWLWPSVDLGNGLVRWVLASVVSVGSIRSFFSTWQKNSCVIGGKEEERKHTVSTLTPSNAALGKLGPETAFGVTLGPQRPGIMFLNDLQTSSGIYGPTRLEVHLGLGSALMGYRQVLCSGGSKSGTECVVMPAHVMHVNACLRVNMLVCLCLCLSVRGQNSVRSDQLI